MITDDITKLSSESHKRVDVVCDSQASENCKKEYTRQYRDILKTRNRNNGKDICLQCSRATKATGRQNPNAKYPDLDDSFLDQIDTPFKAWLLGWIASDGTLSKLNEIEISIIHSDGYILEAIADVIKCRKPVLVKNGHMISLTIYSQQMANAARRHLNIPKPMKKSKIVEFPDLTKELIPHFLRGLVEGDGCLRMKTSSRSSQSYPYIEIASSSDKMKESIKEKFGLGNINKHTWQVCGKKAITACNFIYQNIADTPILKRKYEKYQQFISKNKNN